MEPIQFIFNIKPHPKGRPRFSRSGHAYTDAKTREYERKIRLLASDQYKGQPLEGPLTVFAKFYFKPPKSDPKREHHTVKPDADNLLKAVLDAMEGVVFCNDSQFIEKRVAKFYASEPYVWIEVSRIE